MMDGISGSRRTLLGIAGLAGIAAAFGTQPANATDSDGAELLRLWLLVLQAPADLKLTTIPAYTPDGERILVHGYELAQMTENDRWQWANDWLTTWPDGRALLLAEIARLRDD